MGGLLGPGECAHLGAAAATCSQEPRPGMLAEKVLMEANKISFKNKLPCVKPELGWGEEGSSVGREGPGAGGRGLQAALLVGCLAQLGLGDHDSQSGGLEGLVGGTGSVSCCR